MSPARRRNPWITLGAVLALALPLASLAPVPQTAAAADSVIGVDSQPLSTRTLAYRLVEVSQRVTLTNTTGAPVEGVELTHRSNAGMFDVGADVTSPGARDLEQTGTKAWYPNAVKVAGGHSHNLVLDEDGVVWGAGSNVLGQLDDSGASLPSFQPLPGLPEDVIDIAAAANGSRVVDSDGHVWAWGSYSHTPAGASAKVPTRVAGYEDIVRVASGDDFTAALDARGRVWTHGEGSSGERGTGVLSDSTTAQQVTFDGDVRIVDISAGAAYAMALDVNGQVWTWGSRASGALGDGATTGSVSRPARVAAMEGIRVVAISAGSTHALALTADGTVYGWGSGGSGQIGQPTATTKTPSIISLGAHRAVNIAAGQNFSFVATDDGTVLSFGTNSSNTLGVAGKTVSAAEPFFVVPGVKSPALLVATSYAGFVVAPDGAIWGWGRSQSGSLGPGTSSRLPAPVPGFDPPVEPKVAAGDYHSLAVRPDGTVWGWGNAKEGQLGMDLPNTNPRPVLIGGFEGKRIIDVAAGAYHSLVLAEDGTVYASGSNNHGQLGLGDTTQRDQFTPVTLPSGVKIVAVAAGMYHSVLLDSGGGVWSAGQNTYGQLGTGASTTSVAKTFAQLEFWGEPVTKVSTTANHTVAVTSTGSVYVWGRNDKGQIGNGKQGTIVTAPSQVHDDFGSPLTGFVDAAAGTNHTMATDRYGTTWGWGDNAYGQVGAGSTVVLAPVRSITPSSPVAVAGGGEFTVVADSGGRLLSWGRNSSGGLGHSGTTNVTSPTQVSPQALDVAALSVSSNHTLVATADGTVYSWGTNLAGKLGTGSTAASLAGLNEVLFPATGPQTWTDRTFSVGTLAAGASVEVLITGKIRQDTLSSVAVTQVWATYGGGPFAAATAGSTTPLRPQVPTTVEIDASGIPGNATCTADPNQGAQDSCDQVAVTISGHSQATGSLQGAAWHDVDRDGAREQGDGGINRRTVAIRNASGTLIGEATTTLSGHYEAAKLTVATYAAHFTGRGEEGPDGSRWGFTTASADSAVDRLGVASVPVTAGAVSRVDAGMVTITSSMTAGPSGQPPVDAALANTGLSVLSSSRFTATNTGPDALESVSVSLSADVGSASFLPACPATALAVGETKSCTARLANVPPGEVGTLTVTFTGTSSITGAQVTSTAQYQVRAADAAPAMTASKFVVTGANPGTNAAHRSDANTVSAKVTVPTRDARFIYLVRNTGNVPLSATFTDGTGQEVSCGAGTVAAGTTRYCDVYTQQIPDQLADFNAAGTVSARYDHPTVPGRSRSLAANDNAWVMLAVPRVSIDKTAPAVTGTAPLLEGDEVTWHYTVTNTGNVQVTGVRVTDDQLTAPVCTVAALAPGATQSCTATGPVGRQ